MCIRDRTHTRHPDYLSRAHAARGATNYGNNKKETIMSCNISAHYFNSHITVKLNDLAIQTVQCFLCSQPEISLARLLSVLHPLTDKIANPLLQSHVNISLIHLTYLPTYVHQLLYHYKSSRPIHSSDQNLFALATRLVGWLGFNGAFNTIQVISRL